MASTGVEELFEQLKSAIESLDDQLVSQIADQSELRVPWVHLGIFVHIFW